jgi:hypothetical protein
MNHFAFRDFAPQRNRPSGFFQSAEYDNLMDAVHQANTWVTNHQVRVVNIETVVIPSQDCYQFIRVWYEFEERSMEGENREGREV